MTDYDIHSCGYYCNRPACIEAQRNELRDKLFSEPSLKGDDFERAFYRDWEAGKVKRVFEPDEAMMKRVMDGIPDMPIKVQDERSFEEFAQSFAQSARVNGIPEPEPVAYINVEERSLEWAKLTRWETPTVVVMDKIPLYAKKEWVGLTDEEILEEYRQSYGDDGNLTDIYFAHAIEAKLKEKNNG